MEGSSLETRPTYYKTFETEAKDVIEELGHGEGFYVGNIIKYLFRYGKKPSHKLSDLYKARTYLNFLIELLEAEEEA
jgi:hypothetical protein